MSQAAVYAVILPLEVSGLFAVWNWSRRCRTIAWLVLGSSLLIIASIGALLINPDGMPWMVFTGMYLGSGLIWAWWMEGLVPPLWRGGEWLITGLAALALGRAAIGS